MVTVRSKKGTRKSTEPQGPGSMSGDGGVASGNMEASKPGRLWRSRLASPQGTDTVWLSFCFLLDVKGSGEQGEH